MPTPIPSWSAGDLEPDDLLAAAALCRATLAPALDLGEDAWSAKAGELDWSCRRALDHIPDALLFFAGHLALRAEHRLPSVRNGDPERSPAELLAVLEASAAIVARLIAGMGPEERAFHPAGMADRTGYLAIACEEVTMHTHDLAQGLGLPYAPPADLAAKIVARLFPWAPNEVSAWEALQWSTGHIALPNHPRQDENWWWWCEPLAEWNGAIKRRTSPPNWS
jgi:hypothetical protein